MRHRLKVCLVPKPGHRDLLFTLDRTYLKIPLRSISLVLFDIGTTNLMDGCVIALWCVTYQNQVTVIYFSRLTALTSKFPSAPISPVLYDIGTPNLMGGCVIALWCVIYQNQVTVIYFSRLTALTSKFPSAPYLLYYMTQGHQT